MGERKREDPHQIVKYIWWIFLRKMRLRLSWCARIIGLDEKFRYLRKPSLLWQIGVRVRVVVNRSVKGNATDIQSSLLGRFVSGYCETRLTFSTAECEYVASNTDVRWLPCLPIWRISSCVNVIKPVSFIASGVLSNTNLGFIFQAMNQRQWSIYESLRHKSEENTRLFLN